MVLFLPVQSGRSLGSMYLALWCLALALRSNGSKVRFRQTEANLKHTSMVKNKMAKPKGRKRIRDKNANGGDPEPDSKKPKVCPGIECQHDISFVSLDCSKTKLTQNKMSTN